MITLYIINFATNSLATFLHVLMIKRFDRLGIRPFMYYVSCMFVGMCGGFAIGAAYNIIKYYL